MKSDQVLGVCQTRTDLFFEARGEALVSVEQQNPLVLEIDIVDRPVLMRRVIIKLALNNPGTPRSRDLERPIGTVRVEDYSLIGPAHSVQAIADVYLLILGEDYDREWHLIRVAVLFVWICCPVRHS